MSVGNPHTWKFQRHSGTRKSLCHRELRRRGCGSGTSEGRNAMPRRVRKSVLGSQTSAAAGTMWDPEDWDLTDPAWYPPSTQPGSRHSAVTHAGRAPPGAGPLSEFFLGGWLRGRKRAGPVAAGSSSCPSGRCWGHPPGAPTHHYIPNQDIVLFLLCPISFVL